MCNPRSRSPSSRSSASSGYGCSTAPPTASPSPTPARHFCRPYVRPSASVEHTLDVAAALKGVLRGTLRVGIMQSVAFLDIADLLGRFHRRYPDVEIQVRPSAGGSLALVEELKRGGIDIAFVSLMDTPAGLSTTELGSEDLDLVGTPDLLPPRRARVELRALSEATFVDFPAGWGIRVAVDRAFAAAGVSRQVTIEVADVNTCLQLISAGLGVALLPRSLVAVDDRLQTRRLASPLAWRVAMALPANRPIRAAAGAFAELVMAPEGNCRSRPNQKPEDGAH